MHKCQCKQTYKQIFNLCQNIKEAIAMGKEVIVLNNVEVNIMIWDTAGEERFRSVAPNLLRGSNGLILIFDVKYYSPNMYE